MLPNYGLLGIVHHCQRLKVSRFGTYRGILDMLPEVTEIFGRVRVLVADLSWAIGIAWSLRLINQGDTAQSISAEEAQ